MGKGFSLRASSRKRKGEVLHTEVRKTKTRRSDTSTVSTVGILPLSTTLTALRSSIDGAATGSTPSIPSSLSLDSLHDLSDLLSDTSYLDSIPLENLSSLLESLSTAPVEGLSSGTHTISAADSPLYHGLIYTIKKKLGIMNNDERQPSKKEKKKRGLTHSVTNLLTAWKAKMEQVYAEQYMNASESFCTNDRCCDSCLESECIYMCLDCIGVRFSKGCLLHEHRYNPLHCIKVFRDGIFEGTSLGMLGLVVQLNHRRGDCRSPNMHSRDFTVYHTNGPHHLKIAFCGCRSHLSGNSHLCQIFRQRWIPATWKQPRTCFTFAVMNKFHILNLQSKCNLYDYYCSLKRLTNNAGLHKQPNHYNEFSFVVRVWRHLKLLKRAGRMQDPEGVMNMGPGDLVPKCPACPAPGRNLPLHWRSLEPARKWIYEKLYAIDACFKLSMKAGGKKRSDKDPELASGHGVFVNEYDYHTLLKSKAKVSDDTAATCGADFHAINDAKNRASSDGAVTGRRVTGVAGIKCARHAFVERVADLQKGERFLNVDYVVFDALRDCELDRIGLSYDIYCKWHIHAEKRARENFPPEMVENFLRMERRGFVPKLHLYAHGPSCRTVWSLNYHSGVGRTDGESTERDWAAAVVAAMQTAEMNPGARHGALDDHWCDKNFRRIVSLRALLLKWFRNALKWMGIQRQSVTDLERGLAKEKVDEWKAMVEAWELDHSKPDPYDEPEQADQLKTLHERYAADDSLADALAAAQGRPRKDLPTSYVFMKIGADLRRRQTELKKYISTSGKLSQPLRTLLQTKRTALQRDIYKWTIAQHEYMPHIKWARTHDDFSFSVIHGTPLVNPYDAGFGGSEIETSATYHVAAISANDVNDIMDVDHAEHIKLWLPSDVPYPVRHLIVTKAAIDAELEILTAELHDSLVAVRKLRRVHTVIRANYNGDWQASSTSATRTRQRRKISDVGDKIESHKIRYQHAWEASSRLDPGGAWTAQYRRLKTEDIRGPNLSDDITDLAGSVRKKKPHGAVGQGTYEQSWIWLTVTADDEPEESVRVQWAKTRATAERWEEEMVLVVEEMRRTLASFEWSASWWDSQVGRRPGASEILQHAVNAHARRQAAIFRRRVETFARAWIPELIRTGHAAEWTSKYLEILRSSTSEPNKSKGKLTRQVEPADLVFTSSAHQPIHSAIHSISSNQLVIVIPSAELLVKGIGADAEVTGDGELDVCDAVEQEGAWDPETPQHTIPDTPDIDEDTDVFDSDSDTSSDGSDDTISENDLNAGGDA